MNNIKIGIADDHTLFRESLAALLQQVSICELVIEAPEGAAFLEAIGKLNVLPEIVLVDIDMPGMNGIMLTEHLKARYPQVKVIMLSVYAQERIIVRSINAGAEAYLVKNCEKEEFIHAIQSVYTKGFYMSKQVLDALRNVKASDRKKLRNINAIPIELTKRETEVLQLICREYSTPKIAEQLFISIRTAEGHRNNLLQKTGCMNTVGLVLFAIKWGIFEVDY
jgi:DNA-binding NarL/FixJ family response regulator